MSSLSLVGAMQRAPLGQNVHRCEPCHTMPMNRVLMTVPMTTLTAMDPLVLPQQCQVLDPAVTCRRQAMMAQVRDLSNATSAFQGLMVPVNMLK